MRAVFYLRLSWRVAGRKAHPRPFCALNGYGLGGSRSFSSSPALCKPPQTRSTRSPDLELISRISVLKAAVLICGCAVVSWWSTVEPAAQSAESPRRETVAGRRSPRPPGQRPWSESAERPHYTVTEAPRKRSTWVTGCLPALTEREARTGGERSYRRPPSAEQKRRGLRPSVTSVLPGPVEERIPLPDALQLQPLNHPPCRTYERRKTQAKRSHQTPGPPPARLYAHSALGLRLNFDIFIADAKLAAQLGPLELTVSTAGASTASVAFAARRPPPPNLARPSAPQVKGGAKGSWRLLKKERGWDPPGRASPGVNCARAERRAVGYRGTGGVCPTQRQANWRRSRGGINRASQSTYCTRNSIQMTPHDYPASRLSQNEARLCCVTVSESVRLYHGSIPEVNRARDG
ncbi:hypothetical protein SKAU_G00304340 [Synaphobranchus kaupii]|uniref:Uncharacterized protein n=1 Tax=Synaphobranchus kaupii TaxID=118154 RepID=A0A9Q1INM0_SYNKA|nr:hypothetical protein SKAU_G00304340 [Synaphobranchus kaupii]